MEIVGVNRLGTRAGAYRLVRILGRGGMGVVYEALHESIGQRAAVKLLLSDVARSADYAARFDREARAACAVRHPGLVQVFDSGQLDDGTPFLLMELLEGESLRARLTSRVRLSFDETIRVIRQLASALDVVHEAAIVHRDVKPENVMLLRDDAVEGGVRAKLLDFGIARSGFDSDGLTQEGTVIGTPAYMSPEQCAPGGVVSAASDVYALGILVFEMLDGAPPFAGDAASVMQKHLVAEPEVHRLPFVPGKAKELFTEMLAKDPARRPAAAAVATRLGEVATAWEREALSQTEPRSSVQPLVTSQRAPIGPGSLGARLAKFSWRQAASSRWSLALVATLVAAALGVGRWNAGRHRPLPSLSGMVRFEGGTFVMGRTAAEADAECAAEGAECLHNVVEREQPPRNVRLKPFYFDVNEVTARQFVTWLRGVDVSVVGDWITIGGQIRLVNFAGPYSEVLVGPDWTFRERPESSNKPIVQVTWDAARMYCAALGKRLPTEAEWEFAARGRTSRRYPWGDAPPTCEGTVFARDTAEEGSACLGMPRGPADISGSPQDWTPEGVHDLFGNVQEWVEDAFVMPYYPDCGACENPVVEPEGEPVNEQRVVRGGAWSNSIFGNTSARARFQRTGITNGVGFRCALTER